MSPAPVPAQQAELQEFFDALRAYHAPILVEGPRDQDALETWGIPPAQVQQLNEYNYTHLEIAEKLAPAGEIVLLFDYDKKGRELTKKFRQLLPTVGANPNVQFWRRLKALLPHVRGFQIEFLRKPAAAPREAPRKHQA